MKPFWVPSACKQQLQRSQRKKGKKKKAKAYVVYIGRVPELYTRWREAHKQVNGFSMASFEGFDNLEDAQACWAFHCAERGMGCARLPVSQPSSSTRSRGYSTEGSNSSDEDSGEPSGNDIEREGETFMQGFIRDFEAAMKLSQK